MLHITELSQTSGLPRSPAELAAAAIKRGGDRDGQLAEGAQAQTTYLLQEYGSSATTSASAHGLASHQQSNSYWTPPLVFLIFPLKALSFTPSLRHPALREPDCVPGQFLIHPLISAMQELPGFSGIF